jgi:hypothetical protein
VTDEQRFLISELAVIVWRAQRAVETIERHWRDTPDIDGLRAAHTTLASAKRERDNAIAKVAA